MTREREIALAALAIWLVFVIFVIVHHEPWCDEVRALSIAIGPAHVWGLPAALRDEGHPVLWYLILRWLWFFVRQTYVLKIASVAIAAAACAIFVFRAPFPLWQRVLFLAGVLPLYEYSVVARNYGIAMLLLFAFAATRKRAGPLVGAILLALLANTDAPAAIVTPILALVWLGDQWRRDAGEVRRRWKGWVVAAIIVLAGFGASLATALPDSRSVVVDRSGMTASTVAKAFGTNLLDPGLHFPTIPPRGSRVAIWIFVAGLIPNLDLVAAALLGYASVGTMFTVAYGGSLRHQGVVFIFALVLYWIAVERRESGDEPGWRAWGARFGVPFLLVCQVTTAGAGPFGIGLSFQKAWQDVERPYAMGEAVADLVERTPGLHDAILIAEPPVDLEPLPYYISNRLYFSREQRFGRFAHLTTSERESMSLHDLLESARQLRARWRVPILILLRPSLGARKSPLRFPGSTFTWNGDQLAELHASTRHLAEFRGSISGEDESVYLLGK